MTFEHCVKITEIQNNETIYNIFLISGLIKLSQPIPSNPFVRPVKLPTNCGLGLDEVSVIAVGNGDKLTGDYDRKIRHAYLKTMSNTLCANVAKRNMPWSVFCVDVLHGQSIFSGDSGI